MNIKNDSGETPLSQAADWGNENIVELLLEKGADVRSVNEKGQTPLQRGNGWRA